MYIFKPGLPKVGPFRKFRGHKLQRGAHFKLSPDILELEIKSKQRCSTYLRFVLTKI